MQSIYTAGKLLVLLLAACLLPIPAMAAQTLKYTDHEPLGGMRTRFIKDVFFAAIEKESNGRLKIEDHWGSEIASGYDALRVIGKEGAADIGIVVPEYAPANLPLHQIFKSFPVGPRGDKQVAFLRSVYAEVPDFQAELHKENVVPILFSTGFPVAFFSAGPLNTLEDIKGGKWRSASFWHHGFLRNAGATPVSIPWGEEVYKAMQNKTLDGLMVNVDSGYMLNVHKVAPNVLVSRDLWLGHVYLLVINKSTWDGLAQEDRDAIQRAAETAYKTLGAVMDKSFDALMEDMKKDGVKIRILDSKEVEQWKTATLYEQVQAAWVQEQEDKGMKDAGPVLKKVSAILMESLRCIPSGNK